MIERAVEQGLWKGIKLSRNEPELTHLFFTDDLVIFSEASVEQLRIVMECLDKFCKSSGQRVNFQKSQLFCSNNVNVDLATNLSTVSNIPLTTDLGHYLGVPSVHGKVNSASFGSVIERMSSKLAGWKSKSLSIAGRCVLAQSVLSTIPLYPMQTFILPIELCHGMKNII